MFSPWVEAGAGFSRVSTQFPVAAEAAWNGWAARAGVGAHMFLNSHVAITPSLTYTYQSYGDDATLGSIGANQTVWFTIGVSGFFMAGN